MLFIAVTMASAAAQQTAAATAEAERIANVSAQAQCAEAPFFDPFFFAARAYHHFRTSSACKRSRRLVSTSPNRFSRFMGWARTAMWLFAAS